ncbi:MAG TPA: response regulator transcription factor [Allosphingosinicella sp.]|nr:response regulator transcription factor [Allosphingosinicella sp.]
MFCEGLAHAARRLRPAWELLFANSAAEAHRILASGEFDLAIVDVGLPETDGFSLLRLIAASHPELPQILISGRSDAAVRVRAKTCGARGFIAKSMSPDDIVESIEAVLRGEVASPPTRPEAGMPALSARQAEILELLSEGHGNKEIRHRLGIAERTVRAHLTELFLLLDAHSRTQALIRARELGLIA